MSRARVIKLGGSLLDWPEWPIQLRDWLAAQPLSQNVLIAGGGALADLVRGWDRDYCLDSETAHWLAIDAMSVTARLAARLLDVELVNCWRILVERCASLVVFDSRAFLRDDESKILGPALPHDWRATSDSIAARVAEALAGRTSTAVELVLLKSALPRSDVVTLAQAAELGYVDEVLPTFAPKIARIRCVNLRAAGWPEWMVAKCK